MNNLKNFLGILLLSMFGSLLMLALLGQNKEIFINNATTIKKKLRIVSRPRKDSQKKSAKLADGAYPTNWTSNHQSMKNVSTHTNLYMGKLLPNSSLILDGNKHVNETHDTVDEATTEASAPVDDYQGNARCTPKKNILFLKTHKTGSSTVQNILYRYGDIHELTFALPARDVYMGTPSLFHRKFAIASPSGKYNILANHARFNRAEMDKIMFEDSLYITILRHPSTQFESMYVYYGFKTVFGADVRSFSNDPRGYYSREGRRPMHSALNPSLYDLGMRKRDIGVERAINGKIASVDSDFDFVLIAEYLPESLILLKDLLCWDFSDITYFSANERTKSKATTLPDKTFNQLYKWNHGDALLYEHFNRTLWDKIEKYGRIKMARDVRTLQKMNAALAEKCLEGTKSVHSVKTTVNQYVLKKGASGDKQCEKMIRPAIKYLRVLRQKQSLPSKWHPRHQ